MEIIKPDEALAIHDWWQWLHNDNQRGERARLRRCDSPDEVLMQSAFYTLCRRLPRIEAFALNGLAVTAGLLAWVERDSENSLPALLGKSKEGSDKPRFSELRFQQLLASNEPQQLFQILRRAILQADKTADPVQLADSVLHWANQQQKPEWYSGSRQWQYRFARPYYENILK